MDENVVFNNNQSNQAPSSDPPQPEAVPVVPGESLPADPNAPAQATDDPSLAAPLEAQPVDPSVDTTTNPQGPQAPVDPDQAQLEAGTEEPPPPPPAGFLGGGMLKKILIGLGVLVLLIVLVLVLMPKGDAKQQVKLQWWGLWEEGAAVQSIIADFKKENPNIDVEYQKRTPEEYRDKLISRIDTQKGPDIFRYHNSWRPMLKKTLLPLSADVISPQDFTELYYPVMQKDLVSNGAIYGLPMYTDSLAMYVNPQMFDAAGVQVPTTWEDFVKVSKQLTVRDSNGKITTAGAALGTYDNVTHASDIISLLFVQQGVNMDKFTADPKKQQDALTFYTSFATGNNKVWDTTLDNSILAFSRGKLAIYFGYSWDTFAIQRANKDLKFAVYPVPSNSTKKETIASYWVEGINAKSKNQKAALEFVKFLAKKETAEKFYAETAKTRAFGEPYARKDLREKLREEPLVYPFLSQMDNASSTMFASDTHDGETGLNTMLNTYLGTAIRAIIIDSESAETVVKDLNSGVLQVHKKYDIKQTK